MDSNEIIKFMLTIGSWAFCHIPCLQCLDSFKYQNDGLLTVVEGLWYCNSIGRISGERGTGSRKGEEILEHYGTVSNISYLKLVSKKLLHCMK